MYAIIKRLDATSTFYYKTISRHEQILIFFFFLIRIGINQRLRWSDPLLIAPLNHTFPVYPNVTVRVPSIRMAAKPRPRDHDSAACSRASLSFGKSTPRPPVLPDRPSRPRQIRPRPTRAAANMCAVRTHGQPLAGHARPGGAHASCRRKSFIIIVFYRPHLFRPDVGHEQRVLVHAVRLDGPPYGGERAHRDEGRERRRHVDALSSHAADAAATSVRRTTVRAAVLPRAR